MGLDKILKMLQRKALKGTHLLVIIKEIQAVYFNSPFLKDIYLYLAQNKLPSHKATVRRTEILGERYLLLDSLLFNLNTIPGKRISSSSQT